MALFTDGKVASIEDLKDYESAVLQTAALEGIDLTAKLKLAQREIGFEISTFLSRHGYSSPGDITRVMVTDSLHHWLCLRTLELFYRDAYNSQVNDRYQGKWKEFGQLSRRAADTALDLGIGMVGVPVEKAADLHVSTEPGGILGPRSYYVSMAWLGTNGRTGERCDAVLQEVGASMLVCVAPPQAPANIAGWFVYAGATDKEMRRQNEAALQIGASWNEDALGLRTDLADIPVQTPEWYVRRNRVLSRG